MCQGHLVRARADQIRQTSPELLCQSPKRGGVVRSAASALQLMVELSGGCGHRPAPPRPVGAGVQVCATGEDRELRPEALEVHAAIVSVTSTKAVFPPH